MDEDGLSTQVFQDPVWIQNSGGWLHSNNIAFYFAISPFQHRLSANNTVIRQSEGNPPLEAKNFSTRKAFEAAIEKHLGISYVVDFDPLESRAKDPDGSGAFSSFWVIRKQDRKSHTPGDVKILDYYYVLNGIIFQAPRLESILNYRLTNTLMETDKIVNQASTMPVFSPAYGHTFFPPTQKSTVATAAVGEAQQSKIGTPAPETGGSFGQDVRPEAHVTEQQSDQKILQAALTMTMNLGDQYYDEAPLMGEPGHFRYTTAKNPVQSLKASEIGGGARSVAPSKANTPAPASPTPVKVPASKPGSPAPIPKSSEVETAKPKPKRKKSMAVNDTG